MVENDVCMVNKRMIFYSLKGSALKLPQPPLYPLANLQTAEG